MLHIKLKGMEWNVEHHASTYSVLTDTLDPWGRAKRPKHYFLNVVMLNIKLNYRGRSSDQHISKNFDLTHTPDVWVGLKGQILKLYR